MLFITTKDATMDATDELNASSLDYYSALRSAYRQIRASEIRNGAVAPMDDFDEFDDMSAVTVAPTRQSASISPEMPDTLLRSN